MKKKTILFAVAGLLAVSVVFAAGRRGPGAENGAAQRQNTACPQAVCADTTAAACSLTGGAQRPCVNGTAPAVCPVGQRACGTTNACGQQNCSNGKVCGTGNACGQQSCSNGKVCGTNACGTNVCASADCAKACGVSACGAQRQQQQGCDRRRGGGRGHCRR